MPPIAGPGRLLRREVEGARLEREPGSACHPAASRKILDGRRSITADTALRPGRYFGNSPQFWLDLQSQYDMPWSRVSAARASRGGEAGGSGLNGQAVGYQSSGVHRFLPAQLAARFPAPPDQPPR
jgi:antitoxin HigA-1